MQVPNNRLFALYIVLPHLAIGGPLFERIRFFGASTNAVNVRRM